MNQTPTGNVRCIFYKSAGLMNQTPTIFDQYFFAFDQYLFIIYNFLNQMIEQIINTGLMNQTPTRNK